ncbi:MAG: 50S ribosomal protein L23 [Candidatus Shapirobacteria bacterium]|nr:50S ribosomal protein L23 [Candidatus Shapirobacteria bacterium]
MKLADVIKKPIVSEKSIGAVENNCYAFVVDRLASKNQIKQAVEAIFGVNVIGVRTMIVKKKKRRLPDRRIVSPSPVKKAIVELKKGEKLDIYEG